MSNREILELIIEEFGVEKATQFCEIAATMYDIKYRQCDICHLWLFEISAPF